MNWESKLLILISAVASNKFDNEWLGFAAYPPPQEDARSRLTQETGIELPKSLSSLYAITNGMLIGECFRIGGLANTTHDQLSTLNREFLSYIRESCESHKIQLIFGSEGYTGDLLCLTDHESVVTLDIRNPRTARVISDSLDSFFDDVCLGPGYLDYNPSGDRWLALLRRLGFLAPDK